MMLLMLLMMVMMVMMMMMKMMIMTSGFGDKVIRRERELEGKIVILARGEGDQKAKK